MDDFIGLLESILPEGWAIHDPDMGMDCLLEAPCGAIIEQDGVCPCPERHVSPLRDEGLV